MKTQRNILIAFILNLSFSVLEFFGGLLTNSVAILSDSVHDLGDALSVGLSYFLERKSKRGVDKRHSYGYLRYSVLGERNYDNSADGEFGIGDNWRDAADYPSS